MMKENKDNSARDGKRQPKSPLMRVISLLGSLKFALLIVVLIAVACIIGTLLPQGSQVAKYLQQNPDAKSRMDMLTAMGLTNVFSASWFTMLLVLLSASLSVCTSRRVSAAVKAKKGLVRVRITGSVITHVSMLLILGGGVIRGVWGQKGYMELREGQMATFFMSEKGDVQQIPFGVHLLDFDIEVYEKPGDTPAMPDSDSLGQVIAQWPEKELAAAIPVVLGAEYIWPSELEVSKADDSYHIRILQYLPDFAVDVDTREVISRSAEPKNPAVLVSVVSASGNTNDHWLFANFPDFDMHANSDSNTVSTPFKLVFERGSGASREGPPPQVKDYKSHLQILENDKVVLEKIIEVNAPLSYMGYSFYQASYDPNDLTYTLLQVVKDPGVPVVYAGFALMILGLTIVFYLCPWLKARGEKTGEKS
ncbi:MAG: cytochrome c biogenesis protein ResB [Kiritimatiellia bacterium]|jgi:hypothetical protein|nr:cytochrome c biogenesis protein ResB [Kiritimatiellia bacterium]MDP6847369.1 cytochrome c biogenesis protein ResB [Kiritimatiellia bacterium]